MSAKTSEKFTKGLKTVTDGQSEWFTKTILDAVANRAHGLNLASRKRSADMISDLEELRARIQGGDDNARARLGKLASILNERADQEQEFETLKAASVALWEKFTGSKWRPYSAEVPVDSRTADDDMVQAVLARYGK